MLIPDTDLKPIWLADVICTPWLPELADIGDEAVKKTLPADSDPAVSNTIEPPDLAAPVLIRISPEASLPLPVLKLIDPDEPSTATVCKTTSPVVDAEIPSASVTEEEPAFSLTDDIALVADAPDPIATDPPDDEEDIPPDKDSEPPSTADEPAAIETEPPRVDPSAPDPASTDIDPPAPLSPEPLRKDNEPPTAPVEAAIDMPLLSIAIWDEPEEIVTLPLLLADEPDTIAMLPEELPESPERMLTSPDRDSNTASEEDDSNKEGTPLLATEETPLAMETVPDCKPSPDRTLTSTPFKLIFPTAEPLAVCKTTSPDLLDEMVTDPSSVKVIPLDLSKRTLFHNANEY